MATHLVDDHRQTARTGPPADGDVLAAVGPLLPTIAARAAEIEAARRLPPDLLGELIAAGCFRMILPASHGGLELELTTAMRVLETLAQADASVAWTVMIGGAAWIDLASLPRETFDELFPPGVDRIAAGVINPSGSIVARTGGYRVTGRWSFASGCEHADWILGNCLVSVANGAPQFRAAVFRPDQVEIEDTWRVSGLSGTGSHHFRADDVLVDEAWTFQTFVDAPCVDTPLVRIPPPPLYALVVAGVALGVARAALDDVTALASQKVPLLASGPLAANPLFQFELATADTELRAARMLVYDAAEELWRAAVDGDELSMDQRARFRAASAWAVERAVAVTRAAFRAGGGTSIYLDGPLQRRLRDIEALAQHFLVRRDTMTTAGALLAGQELAVPIF
jgi:alkylation response protein AidB-like acyl-CoA dehydrogenase